MMWLGAAIIILTSTGVGWELSKRLERRTTLLRHMKVALETLDTEVTFAMIPLWEAFEQIAKQLPAPAKDFLNGVSTRLKDNEESTQQAWEEELNYWSTDVDLDAKDIDILKQFGQTLGRQDIEGQRKQIQLTQAYLETMEQTALETQKKYESMYRSLGLLGGLLLVIMLL
ncbi:stage III sporulation protein AB [Salipaludibacillus agaradhaerens]|uniref:Stage III sporulation protein AB n=1 Tax=Salipaludibacillus agaradhaerens TaxID=76935 RepID=A0A9Q4FZD1_SALAG|nr:stage III sporulation protein SpoIIIAB [Salipaludibacillus agaradhaerens]MCR6096678.1 stage III sporulation protein AB [Salipaludibacillus agaradhaerens]MCR6113763.1 stage III sporulation protein AB [Salipaludibacillus agaradhaerens]